MDLRSRTHRPFAVLALFVAVLLPLFVSGSARGEGEGVQWRDLTLDQAIAEAKEKNTMVLVDVWAGHCHSCGQMDVDVWETPEGGKLFEGLIPIKIESTSAAGREFSARYPVTGLPAIVFLRGDGTELDRVEGYFEKRRFYREVQPLVDGIDPLIEMEARLAARPDSLELAYQTLERYLNRGREEDADSLFARIMRLKNTQYIEKAIVRMARYEEYVHHDLPKTLAYWKMLVEQYPASSSAGGAVNGAFKTMVQMGTAQEWDEWICPILDKNPKQGYLQRAAAMTALSNGFRGECFVKAARAARDLGAGKAAYMDSVATVLEGGSGEKQ